MVFGGCKVSNDAYQTGYTFFKFKEDDIRFRLRGNVIYEHPLFTFEYPRSFGLVDYNKIDFGLVNNITELWFTRPGKNKPDSLFLSEIRIQVHKPWPGQENIDSVIAAKMKEHRNDANFNILEEGNKIVSGNNANYVYFLCYHPDDISLNLPLYDRIDRFLCFELKGFLWTIEMVTFKDEDEEVAPYYQHLIDTFTITNDKPTYKGPMIPE
jgi:hypothetical protein